MFETVEIPGTKIRFEMARIPIDRMRKGTQPRQGDIHWSGGSLREGELKPYWIGTREVTWGEFAAFSGEPRRRPDVDGETRPSMVLGWLVAVSDRFEPRGEFPVTNVSWHTAAAYCQWLSRKTGQRYRLPTEAEWEFACREGGIRKAPRDVPGSAWSASNSKGWVQPTGRKKPNAFGLHDMLGNAWEYCLEPAWSPDFGPVLRGGAWDTPEAELRSTLRTEALPAWSENDPSIPRSLWWYMGGFNQGFRVVRLEDGAGAAERAAYLGRIDVRVKGGGVRQVLAGGRKEWLRRVSGEILNAGDRVLDEVEVIVHLVDEEGKPHFADADPARPTFNRCWPVLVHSARPGDPCRRLGPGERRAFEVDVPVSFELDVNANLDGVGAKVLTIQFAPR